VLPELITHELHGCIIAELHGEFDFSSVPALEQCLERILAGSAPVIILDLAKTPFADLATMRLVQDAERRASSLGRRLVLAAPQPAVARLMEITGLDRQLPVFATVGEAARREGTAEDTMTGMAAD
jgi:anti-sigma B factor antagonist